MILLEQLLNKFSYITLLQKDKIKSKVTLLQQGKIKSKVKQNSSKKLVHHIKIYRLISCPNSNCEQ